MGSSDESSSSSNEAEQKRKKSSKSKHKKHKSKEKKQKKRKHRRRYSTSSSETSASEDEWVEKEDKKAPESSGNTGIRSDLPDVSLSVDPVDKIRDAKDDQDDWMGLDTVIPTYSNDSKREKRKTKKEWEKLRSSDRPGQSARELNPYWKDGGTGLPSEEHDVTPSTSAPVATVGDGGLGWLRKAYQRAKEQAKEENKTLEEVAAERWGSLSNFYAMLEEAEKKSKSLGSTHSRPRDRSRDRNRDGGRFKRPARDSDDEGDHNRNERHSHRYDRHRDRDPEKYHSTVIPSKQPHKPSWMKKPSADTGSSSHQNEASARPSGRRSRSQSPTSYSRKNVEKIEKIPNRISPEKMDIEEEPPEAPKPKVLTDQEMNELSAKIIKAELLGNADLACDLKEKHKQAEAARQEFIKNGGDIRKQGMEDRGPKVVTKIMMGTEGGDRKRIKNKPTETHKDGQRVRYFPDDDKQTLHNMFQREKANSVEDENALFSRLAGSGNKAKPTDDYDLDDIFADKASSSKSVQKEKEREVRRAIDEEKHYKKTMDECQWCFDGKKLEKNIVIAMGEKSYLCIPPFQSLTEGHCLIVPMFHATAATELDEDVWSEMQKFRRAVVNMFKDQDQDVVIYETAVFLKRLPHMYLECVPMPRETGELAPIYFKKAIQECETEWAQNKKLVDLSKRDVRKCVPKGLPYFCVDFGCDSGFAHVIEDEKTFPNNFAQEIIGGMMELDHFLWRKRKPDNFKVQREKLMKFLETWAPYDWTRE